MFTIWECGCRGIRITADKVSLFYDCRGEHDDPFEFHTDFSACAQMIDGKTSRHMTEEEITSLLVETNRLIRDGQQYRSLQTHVKCLVEDILD